MTYLCCVNELRKVFKEKLKENKDGNEQVMNNEFENFIQDQNLRNISKNKMYFADNLIHYSFNWLDIVKCVYIDKDKFYILFHPVHDLDYEIPVLIYQLNYCTTPFIKIFFDSLNKILDNNNKHGCTLNMKMHQVYKYVERPNNESDYDIFRNVSFMYNMKYNINKSMKNISYTV